MAKFNGSADLVCGTFPIDPVEPLAAEKTFVPPTTLTNALRSYWSIGI